MYRVVGRAVYPNLRACVQSIIDVNRTVCTAYNNYCQDVVMTKSPFCYYNQYLGLWLTWYIAKLLRWSSFKLVSDSTPTTYINGTFTGYIGQIQSGKADISYRPVLLGDPYFNFTDTLAYFDQYKISLLYHPVEKIVDPIPIDRTVICVVLINAVIVAILLWGTSFKTTRRITNLISTFYDVLASIFQQNDSLIPYTYSTPNRPVVACWSLAMIVLGSAISTTLMSSLTVVSQHQLRGPRTIQELANLIGTKKTLLVGLMQDTTVWNPINDSSRPPFTLLKSALTIQHPKWMQSHSAGVQYVAKTPNTAYLADASILMMNLPRRARCSMFMHELSEFPLTFQVLVSRRNFSQATLIKKNNEIIATYYLAQTKRLNDLAVPPWRACHEQENTNYSWSLHAFQTIFALYSGGILLGYVCFIIEVTLQKHIASFERSRKVILVIRRWQPSLERNSVQYKLCLILHKHDGIARDIRISLAEACLLKFKQNARGLLNVHIVYSMYSVSGRPVWPYLNPCVQSIVNQYQANCTPANDYCQNLILRKDEHCFRHQYLGLWLVWYLAKLLKLPGFKLISDPEPTVLINGTYTGYISLIQSGKADMLYKSAIMNSVFLNFSDAVVHLGETKKTLLYHPVHESINPIPLGWKLIFLLFGSMITVAVYIYWSLYITHQNSTYSLGDLLFVLYGSIFQEADIPTSLTATFKIRLVITLWNYAIIIFLVVFPSSVSCGLTASAQNKPTGPRTITELANAMNNRGTTLVGMKKDITLWPPINEATRPPLLLLKHALIKTPVRQIITSHGDGIRYVANTPNTAYIAEEHVLLQHLNHKEKCQLFVHELHDFPSFIYSLTTRKNFLEANAIRNYGDLISTFYNAEQKRMYDAEVLPWKDCTQHGETNAWSLDSLKLIFIVYCDGLLICCLAFGCECFLHSKIKPLRVKRFSEFKLC